MSRTIRNLVKSAPRVQATRPATDLIRAFRQTPDLEAVIIFADDRATGVITRAGLAEMLLERQQDIANLCLLDLPQDKIVPIGVDSTAQQAAQRLSNAKSNGQLIAIEKGRAVGFVSKTALLPLLAHGAPETSQTAEASKSQLAPLLSLLTHEIRTPLSGMMGLAEVLNDRLNDTESRDIAQMILESGQALDRTLRNANHMVRNEAISGTGPEKTIATNLHTVVDDIRGDWALLAARNDTSFSIELAPDGPPRITCNLPRIREVIDNLISNAMRFTRSGNISVVLSTQPLNNQSLLTVSVTHSGRRLNAAQKQAMNKALHTGNMTEDIPGWALGLVVSHKLAGSLNGKLSYADNPAGGGVLTFSVPVAQTEMITPPALPDTPLKSGRFELGTVLLVEDHEASALMTITALETAGWTVIHCHTLTDATRTATDMTVQAIVTDLHLGDGNGLSLIEHVRTMDGPNSLVPIISLTAEIGHERSRQSLASGADQALRKPIEGPALVAMLADLVLRRSAHETSGATRLRRRLVA